MIRDLILSVVPCGYVCTQQGRVSLTAAPDVALFLAYYHQSDSTSVHLFVNSQPFSWLQPFFSDLHAHPSTAHCLLRDCVAVLLHATCRLRPHTRVAPKARAVQPFVIAPNALHTVRMCIQTPPSVPSVDDILSLLFGRRFQPSAPPAASAAFAAFPSLLRSLPCCVRRVRRSVSPGFEPLRILHLSLFRPLIHAGHRDPSGFLNSIACSVRRASLSAIRQAPNRRPRTITPTFLRRRTPFQLAINRFWFGAAAA